MCMQTKLMHWLDGLEYRETPHARMVTTPFPFILRNGWDVPFVCWSIGGNVRRLE